MRRARRVNGKHPGWVIDIDDMTKCRPAGSNCRPGKVRCTFLTERAGNGEFVQWYGRREEEDARRLAREPGTLLTERIRHVNQIKRLLATQGVFDFEPIHEDRRERLEELRRWDGQPLPPRLKMQLRRELDRLELVM